MGSLYVVGGKPKILSCGVVVVRRTDDGPRFLMLRAFRHWDFPKGLLERGETPKEAALREVREETTLNDLRFPWGDEYIETGPYSRGKVARYYLGETRQTKVELPINEATGRAEHSEYRWVTLEQARKLVSPRVDSVLSWAAGRLGLLG